MMQLYLKRLLFSRTSAWSSAMLLGVLSFNQPALAADESKAEETEEAEDEETEEVVDELGNQGYIPGYRREIDMGTSPFVPRLPTQAGLVTPQFGAPNPQGWWDFTINGFVGVGMAAAFAERSDPLNGQSGVAIRQPIVPGSQYGQFTAIQAVGGGGYAQVSATTGTDQVFLSIATSAWSLPRTAAVPIIAGNSNVDAWITYRIPESPTTRAQVLFGSFLDRYGVLQAYGHDVVGQVTGIGPKLTVEHDLSSEWRLHSEVGLKGGLDTPPYNSPATGENAWASFESGPTIVPHVHLGASVDKPNFKARVNAHGFLGYASYDKPQPQPAEPIADGSMRIVGLDSRLDFGRHSTFTAGASHTHLHNARVLDTNLRITNAGGGQNISNFYMGQNNDGNGTISLVGGQWDTKIGQALRGDCNPDGFWPEVTVSVFGVYGHTEVDDDAFIDRDMVKFGTQVTYNLTKHVAVQGRFDQVTSNINDPEHWFYYASPRLMLKSDHNSRETISIVYSHWYSRERAGEEPNFNFPVDELDRNAVSVNASMYW